MLHSSQMPFLMKVYRLKNEDGFFVYEGNESNNQIVQGWHVVDIKFFGVSVGRFSFQRGIFIQSHYSVMSKSD